MVSLEEALKYLLDTDAQMIAAMAGNEVEVAEVPTSSAYPQVCLYCMDDDTVGNLAGGQSNYAAPIYRFDCFSPSLAQVKLIRNAIYKCLIGKHGEVLVPNDPEPFTFFGIEFSSGRYSSYTDNTKVHIWEIELVVPHKEVL